MIVIFISMMMIIGRKVFIIFYYESQLLLRYEMELVFGWVDYGRPVPEPSMGIIIFGLQIPFYVCFRNCYCMRRHGKAYEYNNDVRYVWYEQQQQRQYREFCSFQKSPRDILSLNHNDGSFVSTKRFPAHCRRPGSDSSRRSY